MKSWRGVLLIIGVVLFILFGIAWLGFSRGRAYPTGEYIEIYEGTGIVEEWVRVSPSSNPYWVRVFQNERIFVLIGASICIMPFAAKKYG